MTQTEAAATLVVEEVGREAFDKMAPEWDGLLERTGQGQPFYRHGFLSTWLDNFAPRGRLRVLIAREGGRLLAALPLLERRSALYGVPVTRLSSPTNVHSCRFDMPLDPDRPDAVRALWSHLRRAVRFDVLELCDVPEGGAARQLPELARKEGLPVASWESMRTPFIPLDGGLEALNGRLESHFKANLRRRRKKLEQKGALALERIEGGADLERHLEEGLLLERRGWKGRGGTAIACDPITRGFYAELAQRAALRGELALYLLRQQGRAVAFQYGLVRGKTYYLPKTAYDESQRDCSPGQLLMEEVLRDCCARGLTEFDFLGPLMPWKQDWTEKVRAHHWLYVFAPGVKGRTLCALKSRWIPAVKEMLRWKP